MSFKYYKNKFTSPFINFALEQKSNLLAIHSLFNKELRHKENVKWLFILTFPNGGSTALSKLLESASKAQGLTYNCEGQWLIPSMHANGKRWDPNYSISSNKIRATWLNQVKHINNDILIIEKSPPNLCRYTNLIQAFQKMPCQVITFTRNPYAVCASWHSRYGAKRIIRDWFPAAKNILNNETEYFKFLAKVWLDRAEMILKAQDISEYNLSYEKFTTDTESVVTKLKEINPLLKDMSATSRVRVKDYQPQEIRNMNFKQIDS